MATAFTEQQALIPLKWRRPPSELYTMARRPLLPLVPSKIGPSEVMLCNLKNVFSAINDGLVAFVYKLVLE